MKIIEVEDCSETKKMQEFLPENAHVQTRTTSKCQLKQTKLRVIPSVTESDIHCKTVITGVTKHQETMVMCIDT